MSFSETMAGWFAMGETDPELGARTGRTLRTTCALHATVRVADIASFARSTDHVATLHGALDLAPIGHALHGEGQARLFARNPAGAGKVLAYDLPFSHEGRSYYLAGRKVVDGGAPWRMWGETTTLYARLHDGTDAQAPVVGAGVLRISAVGLLQTLTTCRGAGMVGYGRFFAGELWDSYGRRRARPAIA